LTAAGITSRLSLTHTAQQHCNATLSDTAAVPLSDTAAVCTCVCALLLCALCVCAAAVCTVSVRCCCRYNIKAGAGSMIEKMKFDMGGA